MAETGPLGSDLVERLEHEARGRFVKWDARLWRALIEGPATQLAQALGPTGSEAVFTAWLTLLRDAVGLGHVSASAHSFMQLGLCELGPRLLPALAPRRQAEVLAELWNLGENLAARDPWLERIFVRQARGLSSLDGLAALVADVAAKVGQPPARKLNGSKAKLHMIRLFEADPRFLPGAITYLSPTVVAVFDRLRSTPDGGAIALGVWLTDTPEVLGPLGGLSLPESTEPDRAFWESTGDVYITEVAASARNDYSALCTLGTSQCLFAMLPTT